MTEVDWITRCVVAMTGIQFYADANHEKSGDIHYDLITDSKQAERPKHAVRIW